MHPAYFETRFRIEHPLDWPEEFVIISAYATTGERWSDERNAEADRKLEAAVVATGRWYGRVTGYSPTTGHAEPGWAVAIPLDAGVKLGWSFEQDAIYHVQNGELSVVRCEPASEAVAIGCFVERVDAN